MSSAGQDRLKRRDNRGVELGPNRLREAHAGDPARQCVTVRAVGRHRVVRVGDADDPPEEGDLVAWQSVRVAHPVDALVMSSDDVCDLRVVVDVAQDPFADLGMLLHLPALLEGQRTRLLKQAGRKPDLADVMNESAEVDELLFIL